jgi:hypothetical protein
VTVGNTDSSNVSYILTPANNTFSNTCPILVNHQAIGSNLGIVPALTTSIVAGLYIGKAPTTSFAGINLGAANIDHPLGNCRLYYFQVTVDPQKSIDYVERNRNKKVIYRSFVTNSLSLTNLQVSLGGQNVLNSTLNMTYEIS